ncbi:MAG: nucleotidyl transferase AbiEii/AbiGii toxin family protein [Bacteroidales bacterium]|nr:nucleotidyl transferase AbiEii/AbiGii toxin family protein [Candidatus Egerieousia equi]
MLYTETVLPDTLELLKNIQSLDEFSEVRLVGGTALALQIGHRKSIDLDFFGKIDIDIEELAHIFSQFADVQPISSSRMMKFLHVNGIKVDIVNYPYSWIDNPIIENGITLAGPKDIAAMKLSAIANRGARKDFIDCHFLLKQFTLKEMIEFYKAKYSETQIFTILKSLTYFDDAENEPMPYMLHSLEWDEVKKHIMASVRSLL